MAHNARQVLDSSPAKLDNFGTLALPSIGHSRLDTGNKKVPNLNYVKQVENQNQLFQTPTLTPITFVSKDKQMKADYQIDSEVDEVYLPNKAAKQLIDQ